MIGGKGAQIVVAVSSLLGLLAGCTKPEPVPVVVAAGTTPKNVNNQAKNNYDLHGDFAGGGVVYGVADQVTVKQTIQHFLDARNDSVDLNQTLAYTTKMTRDDLQVLARQDASFVKNMKLSWIQLSDSDLEPISHLKLIHLELDYTAVKDLHAIKNMTSLNYLDVSNCAISSKGVAAIAGLRNLQVLKMRNTAIGDDDLVPLYRLDTLIELNLGGCPNLTMAALQRLQNKLPKCDVKFRLAETKQLKDGFATLQSIDRSLKFQDEGDADLSIKQLVFEWQLQSPPPYPLIARGNQMRGQCQFRMKHFDEACRLLTTSLDLYQTHLPDDPSIPIVETQLASALEAINAKAEALVRRKAADRFWRKHPPINGLKEDVEANRQILSRAGALSK